MNLPSQRMVVMLNMQKAFISAINVNSSFSVTGSVLAIQDCVDSHLKKVKHVELFSVICVRRWYLTDGH